MKRSIEETNKVKEGQFEGGRKITCDDGSIWMVAKAGSKFSFTAGASSMKATLTNIKKAIEDGEVEPFIETPVIDAGALNPVSGSNDPVQPEFDAPDAACVLRYLMGVVIVPGSAESLRALLDDRATRAVDAVLAARALDRGPEGSNADQRDKETFETAVREIHAWEARQTLKESAEPAEPADLMGLL